MWEGGEVRGREVGGWEVYWQCTDACFLQATATGKIQKIPKLAGELEKVCFQNWQ